MQKLIDFNGLKTKLVDAHETVASIHVHIVMLLSADSLQAACKQHLAMLGNNFLLMPLHSLINQFNSQGPQVCSTYTPLPYLHAVIQAGRAK